MGKLPYNQKDELSYKYVRQIRFLRNKSQKEFAEIMGVDFTVLSRIENGQLAFTPVYQDRFKTACQKLRVSNVEISSIREILYEKAKKGYK
ncbi:helix-turn-helix domain-containing protein [Domibacillus sp. PGB-M46]|uniref:helix-turn-helix domain-containing protein n=1 Tax=Domibacillus sp. PGB-M46 TaxID=2910255 RepID=UPI001F5A86A7|nr:helix-turn-helix transcriptional regulator [Domibacillus sp. PGB-M46]MCI2257221.1 helix-turn-helix domain-containing protein [Domibacillus sp. PGB-M46]